MSAPAGFGPFDVDAAMAPFERRQSAAAGALSRRDELLRRLTEPEDFAHINDPAATASTGDPSGRTPVDGADIPHQRLAVIVVAGQSNAANTASPDADGGFYERPDLPIFNFNIGDGRCYLARNPLLGCDGEWQAFAVPLAAQLIDAGLYQRVLLVPISVCRTWVQEWAPAGHYFSRFRQAMAGIAGLGLRPDFVLWHQGESNAGFLFRDIDSYGDPIGPVTRAAARLCYTRHLLALAAGLRAEGMMAPVFVARATLCGSNAQRPEIHQAQSDAAADATTTGIFPGPDTDTLPFDGRFDGCHFTHHGNIAHARAWFDVLRQYLINTR